MEQTIKKCRYTCQKLNSTSTDELKNLKNADLYIVAVKDDSLEAVIQQIKVNNIVHTSGSIGLEVFDNKCKNYGVLYPLQTFNKEVSLDFSKTPICIEANNEIFEKELLNIGNNLSKKVVKMS